MLQRSAKNISPKRFGALFFHVCLSDKGGGVDVVPSISFKFVKMLQMFSALLVRARALHFATSVVVLSDIELADQGGSG